MALKEEGEDLERRKNSERGVGCFAALGLVNEGRWLLAERLLALCLGGSADRCHVLATMRPRSRRGTSVCMVAS